MSSSARAISKPHKIQAENIALIPSHECKYEIPVALGLTI